jgi:hypothetical protein
LGNVIVRRFHRQILQSPLNSAGSLL